LIAALACRLGTRIFYFEWLEYFSLVLSMVGLVLVAGGWALLRWSGIAIGFLFFMIPFPFRVETLLSLPLQRLATRASCYLLQTFGILAVAEGNVILLENAAAIEVAQACNGLRMAVSFMAISVATALVIRRPLWERVLVVFSAVPIALLSNIARITWTGYLFTAIDQPTGRYFFHEIAGWLMMPLALGLLVLELWLISFLLKERKGAGPVFFPSPTVSRNISANPVN
jgi:exosortase